MDLWKASPERLIEALRSNGLWRGALLTDPETGEFRASHPVLESIAKAVRDDDRDYRKHEGCFFEIGRESGHLLTAHLHWTWRGQGAGGIRFWRYATVEDLVRDGLRLSRGMGQKNALAGLWWGGGKGVVARRSDIDYGDPAARQGVYRDFGRFVSGLCGCYVTAEDVGTTPEDMAWIHSTTRHTTCIPKELGGSGNPSVLTAAGVVVAIEAALDFLGRGTLAGKTVAMQGLGNVSGFMIEELLRRGVEHIQAVDIDARAVAAIAARHPPSRLSARQVGPGDLSLFAASCDVLVPNAVGAVLDPQTIPLIEASVICGGANNQLADAARDAAALQGRGILYVPDFIANRMGIVNCANEQYGYFADDPAIRAHLGRDDPNGIFRRCQEVFRRSRASGRTTAAEAEALADELGHQPHPIWGHRGRRIIAHLVESGWDRGEPIDYSPPA
jgi:glutamate dehydrogenase/leucine dehydrogenase